MVEESENFFSRLDEIADFDQVVTSSRHGPAPDSWHVVITDVQGSTVAIEAGRYKDVNALGVASIVALRNALPDIDLPYVFGGDGATILVPGTRINEVEVALRGIRQVARDAFAMKLRVSHVPISELSKHGHPVCVGRYRMSSSVVLAAFSGSGFSKAEQWIKDPVRGVAYAVSEDGPAEANLTGFECRWQPVKSRRGSVVSLLVVAAGDDPQRKEHVYREVLGELSRIVADEPIKPVSEQRMKLGSISSDYSTEARLISGRSSGPDYRRAYRAARKGALVGRTLLALGMKAGSFDGAKYKSEFLENTDYRKFDEVLRMILDLTREEIAALEQYLEARHSGGELAYGIHKSETALITCMVGSYTGNHIHFVDGSDGGYALAAKPLKARLKSLL